MFTVPNGLNVVPSPLNRRPCITAFGTRFPPKFAYPSKVHRYRPCNVCTLQGCGNFAVARAVPEVPSAIATTRQPNAQVKARELIIVLTNFVPIIVVFLSLFWSSWLPTVGGHIWPFTPSFGKFCPALQKRRFFRASRRNQRESITAKA